MRIKFVSTYYYVYCNNITNSKRWRTCYFIVNLSVAHKTALSKVTNYQPARLCFILQAEKRVGAHARCKAQQFGSLFFHYIYLFALYYPIGETENRSISKIVPPCVYVGAILLHSSTQLYILPPLINIYCGYCCWNTFSNTLIIQK